MRIEASTVQPKLSAPPAKITVRLKPEEMAMLRLGMRHWRMS